MKDRAERSLNPASTRLSARWLLPARLVWIIILLLSAGKLALGLPLRYVEKTSICSAPAEVCSQGESPTPEQAQALEAAGVSLQAYARAYMVWTYIMILVWWGIGVFIFWTRPDDWMAWLASAWMILIPSAGYETQIMQAYPGLGLPADLLFNLGNILMFLFIGLFPGGQFIPRWTRWYWLVMVAVGFLPSYLWSGNSEIANIFITIFWLSFLIVGPFSQIYRYWRASTPLQRQQTKMVVLGFSVFAGSLLLLVAIQGLYPDSRTLSGLLRGDFFFDAAGSLILLGIAIAVLRFRLWDIDLLIRRTLVYGLLSGALALVFFGSVTILQNLVFPAGASRSPVIVVISTLGVAGLFNPLRKRIQEEIDRRFYRRKYDAAQTLAAFSATARNEVDLERLTRAFVSVVEDTLQPESVSFWIREDPASHNAWR